MVSQSIEDSWRVRILGSDNTPVGSGVLVDGGRVLTCAHVVQGALELAEDESPEGLSVTVDHPGSLSREVSYASVLPQGWAPADRERADVAVLELTGAAPSGCVPARLRACGPVRERAVRVFGQSSAAAPGVWVTARLLGAGGLSPDWVQLESPEGSEERVRGGYSGAGVVDADGYVIGVVVAVRRPAGSRTAWMIPVEAAVRYCPLLADAVHGGPAPAPAWPRGADRELTTALVKLPSMRDPQRRESVLRDAGDEIFDLAERSPVLVEDVRGVVALCLQYADGIDRLAAALRWYERGSLPMREFERVVLRLRGDAGTTP
ncbi:effector-associated domain 2-containing protein [Streptomyces sp. NRRL S-340]|uniref:effector-associated domain 2-containing protein n=1 Tax=Streptomyces sp. NRRL S-340 TaxID=1463901 RepID=UPI000AEFE23E|nr:trypsin-like peptidase domain-containing protein [Streptomyces sp. NRRL S-340]